MKLSTSLATFAAVTVLGIAVGYVTRPVGVAHAAQPSPTSRVTTTADAMPAILAALAADVEIEDGGASRFPRPNLSKRLYFQAFDEVTLVSVYVATGAPADVFRGYASSLASSGFVVRYDLPGTASGVTVLARKPGGSSALVTLSQGKTGTLVTVVETLPAPLAVR